MDHHEHSHRSGVPRRKRRRREQDRKEPPEPRLGPEPARAVAWWFFLVTLALILIFGWKS